MDKEKKEELEVKEAAEVVDETEEMPDAAEVCEDTEDAAEEENDFSEETDDADSADDAAEETDETDESEADDESDSAAAGDGRELKVSSRNKRAKKAERREAKAARKEANKIEEKRSRPNNLLLAILIFGVLIGMFVFVKGYTYYTKEASLETYIANNGGEEQYGSMYFDVYTTGSLTAQGNSMKLDLDVQAGDDEETVAEMKEYYTGEDGQEALKYYGAYFLTTMKPETRGFSGDITVSVKIGDEEIDSISMTYKEAKKFMKEFSEDSDDDEAADESEDAADEASDEADDNVIEVESEDDNVEVEVETDEASE